ncbi:hypothetical protein GCM10018953_25930 [Streptosporangium nondiastaticum]
MGGSVGWLRVMRVLLGGWEVGGEMGAEGPDQVGGDVGASGARSGGAVARNFLTFHMKSM